MEWLIFMYKFGNKATTNPFASIEFPLRLPDAGGSSFEFLLHPPGVGGISFEFPLLRIGAGEALSEFPLPHPDRQLSFRQGGGCAGNRRR